MFWGTKTPMGFTRQGKDRVEQRDPLIEALWPILNTDKAKQQGRTQAGVPLEGHRGRGTECVAMAT